MSGEGGTAKRNRGPAQLRLIVRPRERAPASPEPEPVSWGGRERFQRKLPVQPRTAAKNGHGARAGMKSRLLQSSGPPVQPPSKGGSHCQRGVGFTSPRELPRSEPGRTAYETELK